MDRRYLRVRVSGMGTRTGNGAGTDSGKGTGKGNATGIAGLGFQSGGCPEIDSGYVVWSSEE